MVENEDWVSLREFAKRVGVNPNAVTSALKSGRIERRETDKKFHWPTQSVAWGQDRNQTKVRGDLPETEDDFDDIDDESDEVESDAESNDPAGPKGPYKRAQLRKERAVAGLKELELQRERGEMVRASYVRSELSQLLIDIREAVMTIPDRVSSELAAELAKKVSGLDLETARELVHAVWRRESRLVLEKIARGER